MIKAVAILLVLGSVCAEMPGIWLDEPVLNPKIIKGENASETEFPYMVSYRRTETKRHACGGSILTKHWALTAGHCCVGGTKVNRYLATGSIYQNQGMTSHAIDKIIIHEDYDPNQSWRNDICLIRVSQPFNLGSNVKQITLPKQDWPVNSSDTLVAFGWGYTIPGKPDSSPNTLQKANFTALSNDDCGNKTGISMFPGYLCARGGSEGQGVCHGDSGSPIVKNGVQVGIASWVFLPCGSGKPDFFCRVPNYINWIKQQLGSEAGQLKFIR